MPYRSGCDRLARSRSQGALMRSTVQYSANTIRNVSLVVALYVAVWAGGFTRSVSAQPGELAGFSFLRIEPSARAAALGGSFSAVHGDDANAMFYNPALMNQEMHRAFSVSFLNHVSDLRAGFLSFGLHDDRLGSVGFGIRYLSWGKIDETDVEGNELGTFAANDVAFTVGLARAYTDRIHVGINVHSILSAVSSFRSSALALDIGVLYYSLENDFTFSASINNAGVVLNSLGATSDELPLDFKLSLTKRLQHLPLLLSVTGYNLHDYDTVLEDATPFEQVMEHIAIGGEFQFSEGFNVRIGYNHRRHETLKTKTRLDFAGFGFGVGLKISSIRFDYAFNSWSELGGLNQFTVRTVL